MNIAEIRRTIDELNWTRNDISGSTREEFKRMQVPARLIPRIDAVKALVIPPRFARDIHDASYAVERAVMMIGRWNDAQMQEFDDTRRDTRVLGVAP